MIERHRRRRHHRPSIIIVVLNKNNQPAANRGQGGEGPGVMYMVSETNNGDVDAPNARTERREFPAAGASASNFTETIRQRHRGWK